MKGDTTDFWGYLGFGAFLFLTAIGMGGCSLLDSIGKAKIEAVKSKTIELAIDGLNPEKLEEREAHTQDITQGVGQP